MHGGQVLESMWMPAVPLAFGHCKLEHPGRRLYCNPGHSWMQRLHLDERELQGWAGSRSGARLSQKAEHAVAACGRKGFNTPAIVFTPLCQAFDTQCIQYTLEELSARKNGRASQ
jgi:hypothetical protein